MTAVKKAPARKGAQDPVTSVDLSPRPIEVRGRKILTKMPTAEQLMIVEEVFSEIVRQQKERDYESGKQTIKDFHRVMRGLFADPADSEWFNDGRYTGEVSIYDEETMLIPQKIVEVWRDTMEGAPANRADKRAAARKKT